MILLRADKLLVYSLENYTPFQFRVNTTFCGTLLLRPSGCPKCLGPDLTHWVPEEGGASCNVCSDSMRVPWSGSGLMFWPQACVHRQHQRAAAPGPPLVFRTSLGKWTLLWRLHGAFGSRRGAGAPIWGLVCALDFGWQSLGILGDGAVSTCPELVGDAGKWIVLAAEAPWMLVW